MLSLCSYTVHCDSILNDDIISVFFFSPPSFSIREYANKKRRFDIEISKLISLYTALLFYFNKISPYLSLLWKIFRYTCFYKYS